MVGVGALNNEASVLHAQCCFDLRGQYFPAGLGE